MQLPHILVAVVSPADPSIIQSALHRSQVSLPGLQSQSVISSDQSRASCWPAASAPVWPQTPPSRGQSSSQTWPLSGPASGESCPPQPIRIGWTQVGVTTALMTSSMSLSHSQVSCCWPAWMTSRCPLMLTSVSRCPASPQSASCLTSHT